MSNMLLTDCISGFKECDSVICQYINLTENINNCLDKGNDAG